MMRAVDKILAGLDRREMEESYGLNMAVDFGDDFFNALIYGTLKTLVERVDSSGFCRTSFGEENNVRCYGLTHYPRDTAEAARVLASWGLADYAIRILEFTLRNKPKDQYYIPHVYRPDGSIKANTIQVDTLAHVILAIGRCVEMVGTQDRLCDLFSEMDRIVDGVWQNHYHAEWQLLDAGNYNEQISSQGVICDLFTNCAFAAGLSQMAKMAGVFCRNDLTEKYQSRLSLLTDGIEKKLYDPQREIYLLKKDFPTGEVSSLVNWVSLYAHRWYGGRSQGWENVYRELERETTIDWNGIQVVSGSSAREGILGKYFGFLLAWLAGTGRFESLSRHMMFARQSIVRPSNVYPEWWYYQEPELMEEYWVGFWKKYGTIWQPFKTNPEGDYTVDSGNCEQSAVFLHHCVSDLLGVHLENGSLHLSPRLPFEFGNYSVKDVPLFMVDGKLSSVSYELGQNEGQTNFHVSVRGMESFRVTLAIPDCGGGVKVCVDGQPHDFEICKINEVRCVTIELQKMGERDIRDFDVVVGLKDKV
jgi:hypothetical protein